MLPRVSASDLNLFFQRLSTLIESGVPLHEALFFLEEGETNPQLRLGIHALHTKISHGKLLSRAMGEVSELFPKLTIELIAVGETTGMMVEALRRVAKISGRDLDRKRKVWAALSYPLSLVVVMLTVVGLFVGYVAPGDSGLFAALGDNLPWPSQVLIACSHFFTSPTLLTLTFTAFVLFVLVLRRIFASRPDILEWVHAIILSTPVLGPLTTKSEMARTLDILASSIRVGSPLLVALKSCRRVAANLEYRRELRNVAESVKAGGPFGQAFARMHFTPRYVGAMMEVTDAAGNLDKVLLLLADGMEEDLTAELDTTVKLLEPILLLVSGFAAGFVTIATFLPVVRLISNL